jgi:hypothetical protein
MSNQERFLVGELLTELIPIPNADLAKVNRIAGVAARVLR